MYYYEIFKVIAPIDMPLDDDQKAKSLYRKSHNTF